VLHRGAGLAQGSLDCPIITRDKSSDVSLTSTQRSRIELKRGSRISRNMKSSDAGLSKSAYDASLR